MADRLAADGFNELGYQYVNIDDCWSEKERDSSHKLIADKSAFLMESKIWQIICTQKGLN
jgi:alpha-N-acetylgalactosaminidase